LVGDTQDDAVVAVQAEEEAARAPPRAAPRFKRGRLRRCLSGLPADDGCTKDAGEAKDDKAGEPEVVALDTQADAEQAQDEKVEKAATDAAVAISDSGSSHDSLETANDLGDALWQRNAPSQIVLPAPSSVPVLSGTNTGGCTSSPVLGPVVPICDVLDSQQMTGAEGMSVGETADQQGGLSNDDDEMAIVGDMCDSLGLSRPDPFAETQADPPLCDGSVAGLGFIGFDSPDRVHEIDDSQVPPPEPGQNSLGPSCAQPVQEIEDSQAPWAPPEPGQNPPGPSCTQPVQEIEDSQAPWAPPEPGQNSPGPSCMQPKLGYNEAGFVTDIPTPKRSSPKARA
jgi:hypothetical protein